MMKILNQSIFDLKRIPREVKLRYLKVHNDVQSEIHAHRRREREREEKKDYYKHNLVMELE
jgi:hypothetical protein